MLTPLRTVGVMGDCRTYANMVAVRMVTSDDGMTADWARVPYDVLARISNRIVNEVPGREPRGLRHHLQAPLHHRMGVAMRVLVVGGGAREHALVWKLAQSPRQPTLYCAPGNAGTAALAENVPISAEDVPALVRWAEEHRPDLTIVGPEAPLVAAWPMSSTAAAWPSSGPPAPPRRSRPAKPGPKT